MMKFKVDWEMKKNCINIVVFINKFMLFIVGLDWMNVRVEVMIWKGSWKNISIIIVIVMLIFVCFVFIKCL